MREDLPANLIKLNLIQSLLLSKERYSKTPLDFVPETLTYLKALVSCNCNLKTEELRELDGIGRCYLHGDRPFYETCIIIVDESEQSYL